MESLPRELVAEICLLNDVKTLISFAGVNRRMRRWLMSNDDLIKKLLLNLVCNIDESQVLVMVILVIVTQFYKVPSWDEREATYSHIYESRIRNKSESTHHPTTHHPLLLIITNIVITINPWLWQGSWWLAGGLCYTRPTWTECVLWMTIRWWCWWTGTAWNPCLYNRLQKRCRHGVPTSQHSTGITRHHITSTLHLTQTTWRAGHWSAI